jgi:hypothetical protein
MTLEEVMQLAAQFGPGERWTVWMKCGTHNVTALPTTETGGEGGPFSYCPICLCAWDKNQALLNVPKQGVKS